MPQITKKFPSNIISIILPVHNDAAIITRILHSFIKSIQKYHNYEVVIVDNGSTDSTVSVIRRLCQENPHIRVLILSRKYDFEIAITAGLDNCIGDYVIILNRHTDPPEIIQLLVTKLSNGYDVVLTCNIDSPRRHMSLASRYLLTFFSKIFHHDFLPSYYYCTGLNRRAVNSLIKIRRKKRYLNYLNDLIGFKKDVLLYKPILHYTKYMEKENVLDTFIRILDMTISHTFMPLRAASLVGTGASFLSLTYVVYVFFVTLFKKDVIEGWISTSLIMGIMFFILFMILSVISEYLIRIIYESRDEPLYFISEEIEDKSFLGTKETLNIV